MPVGLLFGVLAGAQGWAASEILAVSLIGFTGSGQFIWLRIAGEGGGPIAAFAVILLINLRYLPMILTVSAPFHGQGPLKGLAAHMVSDESYAVEGPGDDRPARIIPVETHPGTPRPETEEDVLRLLGIPWLPPHLRDV